MCSPAPEHVSLLSLNNAAYRKWCRGLRERHHTGRPGDPFARRYNRELRRWEAVVQKLLATVLPEAMGPQALAFYGKGRSHRASWQYRELDFVSGSAEQPELFVEIKLREQAQGGKSGWGQLNKSLSIASTRWTQLSGLCVHVDMRQVLQLADCNGPETLSLRQFRDAVARPSQDNPQTVWLSGLEVAEFAVERHFLSNADVEELPQLRAEMHDPFSVLTAASSIPVSSGLFDRFRPSTTACRGS